MITSTGSNFGVTGIQIKDYQTEDMAILEAVFEVEPSNADYQACDVMEIYVPSLRFKRSLESTGFIVYEGEQNPKYPYESRNDGTVVNVWIKDENTICVEKLGIYDSKEAFKIFISSLFVPSGKRVAFQKHTKRTLSCTSEALYMPSGYSFAVIEDDWMFLVIGFGEYNYSHRDEVWTVNIQGLPEGFTRDVLIIGGSEWNVPGMGATYGHIENGVLTIERHAGGWGSTAYDPFLYGYFILDNE